MSLVFMIAVYAVCGWMLVRRYQRHLDEQLTILVYDDFKTERRRLNRQPTRRRVKRNAANRRAFRLPAKMQPGGVAM